MAQWKKLLVSGSNISQLNNDSGYLASSGGGIISSSIQIDHDQTTNFVAGEHFLQSAITTVGTVTAGSVTAILPSGTVSGSGQVDGQSVVNPAAIYDNSGTPTLRNGITQAELHTAIGVDAAGTDNSTDVTLDTSSHNYLSLSGQEITLGQIDISDDTNFAVSDTSGQTGIDLTLTGDTLSGTLVGLGTGASPQFTNLTLSGNLTVEGDTFNANVTNLDIEDRFILLNSGSATAGDSGIVFGGSNGVAQSGAALIWDASYNTNDGRAAIVNNMASNATGDQTPSYHVAGVFEGTEVNAATAQADHVGNIRVEGTDIFIYV
jgi:hypothetical protein